MKKQFTLSDADFAVLDRVASSCGLSHSQMVSQYIRRYSVQLEQLLSTYGNSEQPTVTQSNTETTTVTTKQPDVNLEQPFVNPETIDADFKFTTPIPGFD